MTLLIASALRSNLFIPYHSIPSSSLRMFREKESIADLQNNNGFALFSVQGQHQLLTLLQFTKLQHL
jgi:hypothetical protein